MKACNWRIGDLWVRKRRRSEGRVGDVEGDDERVLVEN